MKKIAVLFTEKNDWFSKFLIKICGHKYSHASLSLGYEDNSFYSFNVKGFCTESIPKFQRRGVKRSLLYTLNMEDGAYLKLKNRLEEIKSNPQEMKYSYVGVFLCLLGIPFSWKNHYFCSQFVAEMLDKSHACIMQKKPSLYLPDQLRKELTRQCGWSCVMDVV